MRAYPLASRPVRTARVVVPKAGMSTTAAPSTKGTESPSASSSRSVSQAAEIGCASRTRAVVGRPAVSRSRTVTVASAASSPGAASAMLRLEASGLPRGFSVLSVTLAGSTASRLLPLPAGPLRPATAIRSWLYCSDWALKPAVRQSPGPAVSAYSNVWLQCCQAKLLPSGAVRGSPSIQIRDGHALQERMSDMCSVPSGVTTQPGVPRLNSATDRSARGTGRRSAAGPASATISTGRSAGPRTSASGPKASSRLRAAGTHSRAVPPAASRADSALAYPGPAAARTSEVNAFASGPPRTILTSGRLESASIPPYLDPSAWLHVAVTPAAASAVTRSRITPRSPGSGQPAGPSGQTTSATPIACVTPSPVRTRAAEPSPNHRCAGLSSVYQWSAESTSTTPNGRPITAVAVWYTGRPPGTSAGNLTRSIRS